MKCPKCGSRKVAPIMYGLPVWSRELEERIRNRKLVLGGCCVSGNDPRYYCFGCGQKIGYPAHYDDVVSVSFSRGKWDPAPAMVFMENGSGLGTVTVSGAGIIKYRREMVYNEWDGVLRKLYGKFYFAEWEKTLDEPGVVDGEEWELEVGLKSGQKVTFGGSNAYPPYWDELNRLFKPYFESSGAPAVPKRGGRKYRRTRICRGPVIE